jgi:hypothetical protein
MQLTECPHCLTDVLPKKNGQCPSCRQSTLDQPHNPFCKLRATPRTPVAKMCSTCATATSETEEIDGSEHTAESAPLRFIIILVLIFTLNWVKLFKLSGHLKGNDVIFGVRVGRCAACRKKDGRLIPQHINLAQRTMTVLVRREYRDAVRERIARAKQAAARKA